MDEHKQEELRQQLSQIRIGKSRSCRYPPEIRKAVETYLRERRAAGGRRKDICRELGLPASTVNRWEKRLLKNPSRQGGAGEFRPVVMAPEPIRRQRPPAAAAVASCTLNSPQGYRVEGLGIEQVLYLLRELR
jgi:hypothetical protein